MNLLKNKSVFRKIFPYFEALFRSGSHTGSHNRFPRLAYTSPHRYTEINTDTSELLKIAASAYREISSLKNELNLKGKQIL